jgi:hypothetical protein
MKEICAESIGGKLKILISIGKKKKFGDGQD